MTTARHDPWRWRWAQLHMEMRIEAASLRAGEAAARDVLQAARFGAMADAHDSLLRKMAGLERERPPGSDNDRTDEEATPCE